MQYTSYAINPSMNIVIKGHLPTCILPDYWTRHRLSRRDVDTIVAYIPTKIVWMCAILFGISCPWYTLRSSSSSTMGITMSSKAVAIDMILEKTGLRLEDIDRLDTESVESFDHIPPIPKYLLSRPEYDSISCGITNDLLPRSLSLPSEPLGIIPIIFPYMGLNWIPVGIEGDSICCNAVRREDEHIQTESRPGITHDPKVGIWNEIVYFLTDELVLFTVKSEE
jgi:hypothetical protein